MSESPLRVAHFSPFFFSETSVVGGGERYVQCLVGGLRRTYPDLELHEVYVADTDMTVQLAHNHFVNYCRAVQYPNGKNAVSPLMVETIRKVDIVHVHQAFTSMMEAVVLAAKFFGKKVVLIDHGWVNEQRGRRFDHFGLADAYISPSDFGAAFVREQTRSPVNVVRGGVDVDAFTPPARPMRGDFFLSVGRILPHKNFEMIIAALPPDAALVICGRRYDDIYADELVDRAAGKQVDFIHDAGDDEIKALYRGATATLLCSTYYDSRGNFHRQPELMGFTLLESMACGTPVVCSRVGGMPEYVVEGENGFVIDDVESLTRVFEALMDDPDEAARMGGCARKMVVERFSGDAVARGTMAVYREQMRSQA